MSYPKEVHQQAHDLLSRRRDYNRQTSLGREKEVVAKHPEVGHILREISSSTSQLIRTIAAGGNIAEVLPRLRQQNLEKQQELENFLADKGYGKDYLSTIYSCEKCQDSGFIGSETCDCLKLILQQITRDKLGVPRHLENCNFENFYAEKYSNDKVAGQGETPKEYMTKLKQRCQAYAENFSLQSNNLLLSGSPGLGKTHLSIAIAKVAIDKGYNVLYVPFYQLVAQLEAAKFGRTDDNYVELLATVNDVELLVLDDVGAEFTSQFATSVLYDLVNTRMIANKPTIMNTNIAFTAFEDRYSNRVASRILGCYKRIQFRGSDIRLMH